MEHRTIHGIHFLRLKGNSVERARAHARLLRSEIRGGVISALAKKNECLIRRSPPWKKFPLLQNALVQLYKKVLLNILDSHTTQEAKAMMVAAAEETGLTYETIREAFFQSDVMMILAKAALIHHVLPEWTPGRLPGCTSGVVSRDWTEAGKLLVARNLDYPIVGPWEKNAAVIFNEPTEGGEIPYVCLNTAGIQTGGLTSINREGITLATHAHFGRKVSLRGQSVVVIGDEIIRKSKTIGQAVDQAKKYQTCGNWAFVIASAKENDAVIIQMTPHQVTVQGMEDGFLAHSNFFPDKSLQAEEGLLSGGYYEDLQGRLCRMKELLKANRGHLLPRHMTASLGDHVDCYTGQERVTGNTISVVTTVTSAVFEPESLQFWMGTRQESPTGLGDFLTVKIDQFWNQTIEQNEAGLLSSVSQGSEKNPQLLQAVKYFRQAYQSYHMTEGTPAQCEEALGYLHKAATAYPTDGHLWLQAGMLSFSLGHFDRAKINLAQSHACVLSDHVKAVCDLYRARCFDLSGERSKALELYRLHAAAHEPRLQKAFKSGLKRPFHKKDADRVVLDLQFPDTFEY